MVGKGSFIFVIGFSIIVTYIISNLLSIGIRATEHMSWYNAAVASKSLASSGMQAGLAYLRLHPSHDNNGLLFEQNITDGPYSGGSFRVYSSAVNADIARVTAVSKFSVPGFKTLQDTVLVHLHRVGSSENPVYAWITNRPGNNQFFYPDDIVWGPIHSNGSIKVGSISGSSNVPIFHGMVTAAQHIHPVKSNDALFLAGYRTFAGRINIPNHMNELVNASQEVDGKYYTQDLYIEIDNDLVSVWYSTTEITDPAILPDEQFTLADFNGALYTTQNVSVKGVLDGKLTIGAGQKIRIVDNIIYATTPAYSEQLVSVVNGIERRTLQAHGNDLLGLFAGNDIVIANKNQDFEVHGVLLTFGEVVAENLTGRPLRQFNVWGVIIMHQRGKIRTASNGLIQRYRFDTRLSNMFTRPLYYPGMKKTSFEIISWYESYQIPLY